MASGSACSCGRSTDATALPDVSYSYFLHEYETTGGRQAFGAVLVQAVVIDGVDADAPAQGCAAAGSAGSASALFLLLALVALRRRFRA